MCQRRCATWSYLTGKKNQPMLLGAACKLATHTNLTLKQDSRSVEGLLRGKINARVK
jgi:hypothetical protein